jgi:hypothetical protein
MSFKTGKECTTLAMTQGNRMALCVLHNKMLEGITKCLQPSLLVNGGLHDFVGHFSMKYFNNRSTLNCILRPPVVTSLSNSSSLKEGAAGLTNQPRYVGEFGRSRRTARGNRL